MTKGSRPALVVMAAGLGSRFGGLKQLEPVGEHGEIILEYSVHDAVKAGFGRVIFIINESIESDFKSRISSRIPSCVDVDFCIQDPHNMPSGYEFPAERRKPWGTGHAIMSLRGMINEDFAVINADDFYGAEAYRLLCAGFAGAHGGDTKEEYGICMVGYGVENTLSENGTVARGICDIASDGFLRGIVERTKIMRRDGRVCYSEDGESWIVLPNNSVASMNCWGFPPEIVEELSERFPAFLEANRERLTTAEFFLPDFVGGLLNEGSATVRVLTTTEGCFGVTYREDMPKLQARISALTAEGRYCAPLWSDIC